MADDIVTRLSDLLESHCDPCGCEWCCIHADAMHEIERLRELFGRLVRLVDDRCFFFGPDGEEYNNNEMLDLYRDFVDGSKERGTAWREARRG